MYSEPVCVPSLVQPVGGGFEPVVHCIAHHVHEGITDLFDDGAVEFGVFAVHVEIHFLAEIAREIASQALHFLERRFHRNHAQRHRRVLQFLGESAELGNIALERGVFDAEHARRVRRPDVAAAARAQIAALYLEPGTGIPAGRHRRRHLHQYH